VGKDQQLPPDHRIRAESPREAEVAALLCRGYSTAEIASRLQISRLTVYKHIENIFAKFHVTSRSGLRSLLLN